MVQAIAGETALKGRKMIKSGSTGEEHWRTDFLGKRADGEIKDHSYFTLRARSDSGAVYLHNPGYREKLKPSRKRHGMAAGLTLSTEPVLMERKEVAVQKLMPDLDSTDGLGASLIRMGPGMTHTGPDPRATGGQYYLVVNGSLMLATGTYSAWSTVFVPAADAPLGLTAGPKGMEALLLQFARNSPGPVPTNS